MGLWNFAAVCLPYCLYRNESGEWVALNREYKPLGFNTHKWIAYEQYPIGIKYKRAKKMREKFHAGHCEDENWVFLYNDSTAPWKTKDNMKAYMERLSRLAMLEVDDGHDYGNTLTFDRLSRSSSIPRKYINKGHYIKIHLEKYGNHCYYCGDEMDLEFGMFSNRKWPTIDHIEPVIKGGADHEDNYLVCCKRCNSTKHAKNFEEFRSYLEKKNKVTGHKFYCETLT